MEHSSTMPRDANEGVSLPTPLPKEPDAVTILSSSPEETAALGAALARSLKKGDFVALYGDLGAGKTAFVRGMASVLTPDASPHSPTYTIVNVYRGTIPLYHFDMYRIKDDDDLYSTGFYDYDDGIIAAEWCENIPFALPERYVRVTITKESETRRRLTFTEVGGK